MCTSRPAEPKTPTFFPNFCSARHVFDFFVIIGRDTKGLSQLGAICRPWSPGQVSSLDWMINVHSKASGAKNTIFLHQLLIRSKSFRLFCDHRSRHEGFIAVGCNLSAVVTRTSVIARLDDKCALQGQRSQKHQLSSLTFDPLEKFSTFL